MLSNHDIMALPSATVRKGGLITALAKLFGEIMNKSDDKQETRFIEDSVATQKDLKILKLELLYEIENVKSYLLTRLGSMLIGGFTIIGILGWFK